MKSNKPSASISIGTVPLRSPVVIASGTWPHQPEFWKGAITEGIGAICTKALTFHPRSGNPGIRLWETPCGLLNSIGLQNPGIESFLKEDFTGICDGDVKIIANVAMEAEKETARVLEILSKQGRGLAAVELNISCPNVDGGGMAWGSDPLQAALAVKTARTAWEGPLWVKLTPQCSDIASVAKAAEQAGADALVVANTWLGMAIDAKTERPVFSRIVAGLSGPAVFPLSLRLVWEASSSVTIPVIGCGGVSGAEDAIAMLVAGASAVEIGTAHFADLSCPGRVTREILDHLSAKGYASPMELVGRGRRLGAV